MTVVITATIGYKENLGAFDFAFVFAGKWVWAGVR